MVSDSIINHVSSSPSPKDFPKKKRANRSAKLKQCKLDARREQWLSQVKSNKDSKEEVNGGEFNGPPIEIPKKVSVEEIHHRRRHHDSDSESSPANSPGSSVSGGNDSGNNYTASSSSSSSTRSSFSSGGSYSGSITEEEGVGGGDGDGEDCLDDWEAVADALAADSDENKGKNPKSDLSPKRENGFVADGMTAQLSSIDNVDDAQVKKSKSETLGILGGGLVNSRAWRPDDAFRPQTLPNLAKQRSFPTKPERLLCDTVNPWARTNVPTSCPICCEDLDLTDSSFLPCLCGFRLCLFCHKRILEDDGRCPGCRKAYTWDPAVEKEASVSGGNLTVKLTRSCSMFSRV